MRPSVFEMLESIEHNLSTYVEPELQTKLAISGASSMRFLLRHVAARVEREPQLLFEDNDDKRHLFALVLPLLRKSGVGALSELADDIEGVLRQSVTGPSGFPTLSQLTEESSLLREQLDSTVRALGRYADDCDPVVYAEADGLIVAQLLRQGDRDAQCFDATFSGRMF